MNPLLEFVLLGLVIYLLWRILHVASAWINSSRPSLTTGSAPAATASADSGDEAYILDDEPWEEGGSHIELYPSRRKFVYKSWWIPGDRENEYEYRVDPDCRLMCRLLSSQEMGTKSGEGTFEDRYYDDLHTVRDGVVVEDAVRFIYENNSIRSPSKAITELTAETDWHEIPCTSTSSWPELWYTVIKLHVGEYEARHAVRKELERLKRGLRILMEQTSQSFTYEHDERYRFSEFKPIDESASESNPAILAGGLERSGLTLDEAMGAHFRIRTWATLLGDVKEDDESRLRENLPGPKGK